MSIDCVKDSSSSKVRRRALLTTAAGAVFGGTASAVRSDEVSSWVSFQSDPQNSGVTSEIGPTSGVNAKWTFEAADRIKSSPVVSDGTVCFGSYLGWRTSANPLYGVDSETGERIWTFEVEGSLIASPAIHEGQVIVPVLGGSSSSQLLSVSLEDGSEQWAVSLERIPYPPTVAGHQVFVPTAGTDDGVLYAFSASGDNRWSFSTDGQIRAAPAYRDGVVFVGSLEGVHALDAETGSEVWHHAVRTEMGGRPTNPAPTVSGDTVYFHVGEDRERIVGFDVGDGAQTFEYSVGRPNVFGSPAIVNETMVIPVQSRVVAVNLQDGSERWSRQLGAFLKSSPIISNGMVYIGVDRSDEVYALDLRTGMTRWSFRGSDRFEGSPALVDGTLFIGDMSGTLYALTEDSFPWLDDLGLVGGALALLGGGAYGAWRKWGRNSGSDDV